MRTDELRLTLAHEYLRRRLLALVGAALFKRLLADDALADELRQVLLVLRGLRELLEAEPIGDVALLSPGPYAARSATAS